MAMRPVALCLQDTTELDFNGVQSIGLGPSPYEAQRRMYLRPIYAVTHERVPRVRPMRGCGRASRKVHSGRPGGVKERLRWIRGYEGVAETALNRCTCGWCMSRIARQVGSQELGTPGNWLIRSPHGSARPSGQRLRADTRDDANLD